MAIHDENVFLHVPKRGYFHSEGFDGPVRCRAISGVLDSIRISEGEKESFSGGKLHLFSVFLKDQTRTEIITTAVESTFGWMLAQSLATIKVGDSIIVEIRQASENADICFAYVNGYRDGVKFELPRPEYPKDREARHVQALKDLISHPATVSIISSEGEAPTTAKLSGSQTDDQKSTTQV